MRMRPGLRPGPHWGRREITDLPDPIAGFQGAALRQGSGKGEDLRKRRRKGKGIVLHHLFFYNLTTAQQCIVAATYMVARL